MLMKRFMISPFTQINLGQNNPHLNHISWCKPYCISSSPGWISRLSKENTSRFFQILGTLRQVARQDQVSMRDAAEDLCKSRGSCRHPGDEGATAGGWDGSHSQGSSPRVRQAGRHPVPSSCSGQSSAKHGRAFRCYSKQRQEQLRARGWIERWRRLLILWNTLILFLSASMLNVKISSFSFFIFLHFFFISSLFLLSSLKKSFSSFFNCLPLSLESCDVYIMLRFLFILPLFFYSFLSFIFFHFFIKKNRFFFIF